MPAPDRGTVIHFMREALRDFLMPRDRLRSTLLTETLQKLLAANHVDPVVVAAGLVNPEMVRRGDFEQLCHQCNFEDGRPSELVDLLTVLIEAYQHLLSFGYIIPRPLTKSRDPRDPDRFAVTKAGQQWIAGTDPIPEDRAGYVAALLKLVPNLNSVTKQYAEEALITYERRASPEASAAWQATLLGVRSPPAINNTRER